MNYDKDSQAQKTIGLLTEDSRLYYDLVKALRKKRLAFRSLNFGDRFPMDVGVILTSPVEKDEINFRPVIGVEDVYEGIRLGIQALRGEEPFGKLVIGVDPGKEPGIAVLVDNEVIEVAKANSSADAAKILAEMLDNYIFHHSVLRIGNGAPESRNEILNKVTQLFSAVEIVDEFGTTKLKKNSHIDSAISIARSRKCIERIQTG